jgi:GNAT superfamily N-acetyltransferase
MPHAPPTVEDLYRAMGHTLVRFFGRTPGSHCVVASHALLGCSGLGSIFLNCGVIFGDGDGDPEEDSAEDRLREFTAAIRERGIGGYVCLSEAIQRRLEPLARDLGLEPLPSIPLMARAPGGEPARGARGAADGAMAPATVERVADEASLGEFLAVSEAAFDLPADLYGRVVTPSLLEDPALTVYLCRLDGAAVAAVCVAEEEGLEGISGMATMPSVQGRGIGGRLLTHVLEAHSGRARAFYLTASAAGLRLYRRYGFETVDAATAWVVPPVAGRSAA